MGQSKLSAPKPIKGETAGLSFDFEVSPNDLALATVPGQDFDPRTRCFSEEELKPQPMIKKSRKQVGKEEEDKVNGWCWFVMVMLVVVITVVIVIVTQFPVHD